MIKNKMKYFFIFLGIFVSVFTTIVHLRSGNASNQPAVNEVNAEVKNIEKKRRNLSVLLRISCLSL